MLMPKERYLSPKHAFQDRLEFQLAWWNARLAFYEGRKVPDSVRAQEYALVLGLLRGRYNAACARLEELKKRKEDGWEDLKTALEREWEILGKGLDHSLRKFDQIAKRGQGR